MDAAHLDFPAPRKGAKAWKGFGLGALGIGLTCLGCCLAPLLGLFLTAGAAAAVAAVFKSWGFLAVLGGAGLALVLFVVRRRRKPACCSEPGSECGTNACGLPAGLPGCRLSPEAQASRMAQLRAGLFQEIASITAAKAALRFRFRDNPENVKALLDFIRLERECCTGLRFGMEWEPNGVALVMQGPAPLLEAWKEVARPPAK